MGIVLGCVCVWTSSELDIPLHIGGGEVTSATAAANGDGVSFLK